MSVEFANLVDMGMALPCATPEACKSGDALREASGPFRFAFGRRCLHKPVGHCPGAGWQRLVRVLMQRPAAAQRRRCDF